MQSREQTLIQLKKIVIDISVLLTNLQVSKKKLELFVIGELELFQVTASQKGKKKNQKQIHKLVSLNY